MQTLKTDTKIFIEYGESLDMLHLRGNQYRISFNDQCIFFIDSIIPVEQESQYGGQNNHIGNARIISVKSYKQSGIIMTEVVFELLSESTKIESSLNDDMRAHIARTHYGVRSISSLGGNQPESKPKKYKNSRNKFNDI